MRKTWKYHSKAYLNSARNNLSFLKKKMEEINIKVFNYDDIFKDFGKSETSVPLDFLNHRMLWFPIIYDIHHAIELGGKFLLIEIYVFKNPPKSDQDYMITLEQVKSTIGHELTKLGNLLKNETLFLHSGLLDTFFRILQKYNKLNSLNEDLLNTFYRFPEVIIGKKQSKSIERKNYFNQFSIQEIDEYLEEISIIETIIELLESSIQSNTSIYLKQSDSELSTRYTKKGHDIEKLLRYLT